MLYRDKTGFDKVKEKLELEDPWTGLIINNFDRIVVFMLPFYALQSKRIHQNLEDENRVQEIETEKEKAKLAYEFLENTLTKDVCGCIVSFPFIPSSDCMNIVFVLLMFQLILSQCTIFSQFSYRIILNSIDEIPCLYCSSSTFTLW